MTTHLRARAHLALAQRGGAGRDAHVKAASRCARQLRSEGLPAAEAFALLGQAGLSILRGDKDAGGRELRDVIARFEKADMKLYAASARHGLGRTLGGTRGVKLVEAARGAVRGRADRVGRAVRGAAAAPGLGGRGRCLSGTRSLGNAARRLGHSAWRLG